MARFTHTDNFYEKRLTSAIEYIYNNLAKPLSVAEIAEKAAFSLSHFRKIFTQWTGESPQDYLRRCRLERAAALIRYGADLKIRHIAEECGYRSPEAFDRAFQAYFGMPPTEWRAGGYTKWQDESPASPGNLPHIDASRVEIRTVQPCRVIYQRKVGLYAEGESALWSRLAQLAAPLNIGGQECFGIGLDDPAVTPPARCRFDACIRVPSQVAIPNHIPTKTISGGVHAVLPYEGIAGNTADYWSWLCRSWLPGGGYKISLNPCFERYPLGFPTIGAPIRSELHLPLRK